MSENPLNSKQASYQSVPNNDGDLEMQYNNEKVPHISLSAKEMEESEKELAALQEVHVEVEDDSSAQYFYPIVGSFVGYLICSSIVYCYMEDLGKLDAFYLSMITFTTIGYGDISPQHDISKLFTCGFVFLNLLIVGQLLDYVVDTMIEERKKASQNFLENVFDKEDEGDDQERHDTWVSKEYVHLWTEFLKSMSTIAGTIAVGTIFFCFIVDNHPIIDGIYLSCMTISTVGYGDIVPTSQYARAFGCVYAVGGTVMFGSAVSGFVGAVGEFRLLAKNEKALSNSVLDYETFLKADADGSDSVSKEEFVLFRLQQMGVIPDNLRERAEQQFERMDADGSGDLTMEDIILHQNSHHSHEHQQDLLVAYREMKRMRDEKKNILEMHANLGLPAGVNQVMLHNRRGSTGMEMHLDRHPELPSLSLPKKRLSTSTVGTGLGMPSLS
jgi:potassium channel subfamily K, other eukaryote